MVGVATGISISFSLSFAKTVNPAMGIVETFVNLTAGVSVAGRGIFDILIGGFTEAGVNFAPNGLNCERKFMPVSLSTGTIVPGRKYKNPKIAITVKIKIIIKSIKFLLDINFIMERVM